MHIVCVCVCVFVWWAYLTSILSKFQVNDTVLFTIVSILYIRSLERIHFVSEILYPLANIIPQ